MSQTGISIPTRVFAVVHATDDLKSNLNQVFTAYDCGVDGVFLIGHGIRPKSFSKVLDDMNNVAKIDFPSDKWPPDFMVGVNYLGANSIEGAQLFKPYMEMLWRDSCSIYLDNHGQEAVIASDTIDKIRIIGNKNSEFFGGIAFKHQKQPNYEELCRLIKFACSIDGYVVTTSGTATGSAPDIEKIKLFRKIMPADKRLAVASGVSVENVDALIDFGVTDILVASSVCTDDVIDYEKLRLLARKIRDRNK